MDDVDRTDEVEVGQSGTAGRAQPWLERLTRRSLGDVRVHDSRQAGELARRLGARAFTVGRDVYVRSEVATPRTPEGEALLAHEMYHVAEQSGLAAGDMPLLRPSAQIAPATNGMAANAGRTPPAQGARPAVQRALPSAPAGLASSEASAEAVESAALEAQMGRRQEKSLAPPPDPEQVAERVYSLIVKELLIDRERGAHGW